MLPLGHKDSPRPQTAEHTVNLVQFHSRVPLDSVRLDTAAQHGEGYSFPLQQGHHFEGVC